MLPDRPEARERFLCASRIAKAAHASFAFACRLVAVLGPVVQSRCRFDEDVLYVHKFWDLSFCRRIAAQLVGDDFARHRVRTRHTLEELFPIGEWCKTLAVALSGCWVGHVRWRDGKIEIALSRAPFPGWCHQLRCSMVFSVSS